MNPFSPTMFDEAKGTQLKRVGMQLAADKRKQDLRMAQAYATAYAKHHGECHADIISRWLAKNGILPLGNAAGGLFKGKQWEFTGKWIKSTRTTNHARVIRVWRLK